jgi:hypothetical protein
MTSYEALSLIVWTVSSIAVIVSLVLVYRQTAIFSKQTEYVARSLVETLSESLNNQSHEISRIFVEHPELRPYFYGGKTIDENHPDHPRAEAVAELILDIFWSMYSQSQRGDVRALVVDGSDKLWQDFVGDSFAQSPILVKTLMKRRNWYGQALVEQMNAGLKQHSAPEVA